MFKGIGKIFGAINRMIRVTLYYISFGMYKWSEELETTEAGIRSNYDDIKDEQKDNINSMRVAHAQYSSLQAELSSSLENLNERHDEQLKYQQGALALAKKRIDAVGKENIASDKKYQNFHTQFVKAKANADTMEQEIGQKEEQLENILGELEKLERDLKEMHADLDEIQKEEASTIADISFAKSKERAMSAKAGISTSGVSETRQRMQKLRRERMAKAESAAVLAGAKSQDDMKELVEAAQMAAADDEFEKMLGIHEPSVSTSETPEPVQEKLPE